MSEASRRELAFDDLLARLATITRANGFTSDAGNYIFMGEAPGWGEDDPSEAIVIDVRDDHPETRGSIVETVVPIAVQAAVPVDLPDPWRTIERLVADIKRAVENDAIPGHHALAGSLPNGLERGTTAPIRRTPGATYVGAEVTYNVTFEEEWGSP
jgi:hypothetical protein